MMRRHHRRHRIGAVAVPVQALLLCGLALPASAQLAASGDNLPIQIQADSGIEWQQDAHIYIARGHAVATRGPGEVHADTLIAHYRPAKGGNTGGNTEIYRVEAEGHVTLTRESQNVVGDRAVYDVDQTIAVITGKGLKLTTPTDTVTARDAMEWYDQKQVAVARGNAVAIRNGRTIKADVLTAYMVKAPPEPAKPGASAAKPSVTPAAAPGTPQPTESKINRIDAQGHVVVSNAIDTGKGDFGVYKADTGIATLIGNVVIERGNDVIRGQRGVMDLNNNVSRMMPGSAPGATPQRVQGLFIKREQGQHTAGSSTSGNAPSTTGDRKP